MHVVVTGASSGIGRAIAVRYAAGGADLTLVARRKERLEELAAEVSTKCHVVAADLSTPETATDWIAGAEKALGPIDVLVNNAGVQVIAPTAEVDVEYGEMSLRLNLLTPLRLTRAVLPSMIERGAGAIIDVASMAAIAPTPFMTYYNASKAGIAAASEALRGELRGTGVHVVTVYPGIIPSTDMGEKGLAKFEHSSMLGLQPTGTPEKLADLIHRAVERRHARVIYPRMNVFARWFPSTTRWLMDRFTPNLRQAPAD
jgi:short-subunit dehydrogenase